MWQAQRRRRAVWIALLLLWAGGCSKKISIVQIPPFYSEDLHAVAVVPFENHTGVRGAGRVVAEELAAALARNGTYIVYDRARLESLMDERDLQLATGGDPGAIARALADTAHVQAVLVGSVTGYSVAAAPPERRRKPVYGYDEKTGKRYVKRYLRWTHRLNRADVTATAQLLRLPDGKPLHAVQAVTGQAASETQEPTAYRAARPPGMSPSACALAARSQVVRRLVEQFAIVRKQIKVDPRKALRTAREYYDGTWDFTDTFSRQAEKMYVVVALPSVADRNVFRVVIVRKDQREELAAVELTWSRRWRTRGLKFRPAEIAAGGPGRFTVKFYAGADPVLTRGFTIRP